MPSYWEEAEDFLRGFTQRVLRREAREMILLSRRWGTLTKDLDRLYAELAALKAPSANQLVDQAVYQEFLRVSRTQAEMYAQEASGIIGTEQGVVGRMGIESTQGVLKMIRTEFRRLPVSAVNNMVGHTSVGHPLYDILMRGYPETINKLSETLVSSTARGINPRVTARLMKDDMGGNLTRSLRIARTEQLYVFRESSLDQMRYSGVCTGWVRIEQPDACPECAEVNGKQYSLDEIFDTHPNCRGTCLPVVG